MTVSELIEELNKVEDKTVNVVYMTPDGFVDADAVSYSEVFSVVVLSGE